MITDIETNLVYFSGLLPKRYPAFFKRMHALLQEKKVVCKLLPDTNDIWCRDYMPIQVSKNHFVQFKYDPSYLHDSRKDLATITDTERVCKSIGIKPVVTEIKLDGGNVIKSKTKAIITDRIYKENPAWSRGLLVKEIESLLQVKRVIVIPECPDEMLGHSDGIVRFIEAPRVDPNTVFVTDLSGYSPKYFAKLMKTLLQEDLIPVILPYDDSCIKEDLDATGIYINYIQIGKTVIYPTFGIKEDTLAARRFQQYFGDDAYAIRSNQISDEGGVLNCISWNIN